MNATRVMLLRSRNAFSNLAAEELLLQASKKQTLLFYINAPCVILGRTQNAFKEADISYAKNEQVSIMRRRSGGGTVVHDEGNVNFCWMTARDEYSPHKAATMIAEVLQSEFGISSAAVNERADILVEGMKVSGAAYRITGKRAYHHGTLLVDSDLARLSRVLRSPLRGELHASGTQSVRSKVTNISMHQNMTAGQLMNAVATRFAGNANIDEVKPHDLEDFHKERNELSSHAWVYGQTPRFRYEVQVDSDTHLTLHARKGGIVENVVVKTLIDDVEHDLRHAVVGCAFDGAVLAHGIRTQVESGGVKGTLFMRLADFVEDRQFGGVSG
ncbi:Lipoyltransferase/lipoate-protein ligase [Gracilaria domingensis]|nr:Lipoyltransferase/lipoate-protein ligase [Gracilaria domingensis]